MSRLQPRHLAALALMALACIADPARAAGLGAPLKRIAPVYPPEAHRAGVQGFVEVELLVDASGKVSSVSVVNAKPARTFEAAATRAVKQWQFAPGGGRGKVRVDFTL